MLILLQLSINLNTLVLKKTRYMTFYNEHIFFCTNKRDDSKACGAQHTQELVDYAKTRAKELGLTKANHFRISSSGCLGRCNEGPFLVVYPQGAWYNYSSKEDIEQILQSILLQRQTAQS